MVIVLIVETYSPFVSSPYADVAHIEARSRHLLSLARQTFAGVEQASTRFVSWWMIQIKISDPLSALVTFRGKNSDGEGYECTENLRI